METAGPFLRARRGASLAIIALMLFTLLSLIALTFDMGLLYTAHSEAQRAADASALAGASAFLNAPLNPSSAVEPAKHRAKEVASRNLIRNREIDTTFLAGGPGAFKDSTAEVVVNVDPNARRILVRVQRQGTPLWFARFIGRMHAPVAATAILRPRTRVRPDA